VINSLPSSFLIALRFREVALVTFLPFKTAASSPLVLPLALPSAFGDGLFWGFGVICVGFAAVLVTMRQPILPKRMFVHFCTFYHSIYKQ